MNYRLLKHFVLVARMLHFRKASEAANISQPQLSRSLATLEEELGVRLLERNKRNVSLTPAGQLLLTEAEISLAHMSRLERRVREASVPIRRLRVSFIPSLAFSVLPAALRRFRDRHPAVEIMLKEGPTSAAIDSLLSGDLDLCMLPQRAYDTDPNIQFTTLLTTPILAAVPTSWPLASQANIHLTDLIGIPTLWSPPDQSLFHDAVLRACHAAGFSPQIVQEEVNLLTTMTLVASGAGVAFSHGLVARMGLPGITFLPIADLPSSIHVQLVASWHSSAPDDLIRDLLECLVATVDETMNSDT